MCARWGGYAEKYQYVFSSKVINSVGTTKLGNINWTLETSNGQMYSDYNTTKGQQLCSNSTHPDNIYLYTTDIKGTISSVIINTSGNSKVTAKVGISVNGKEFGEAKKISATATEYEFTGSGTGKISINWTEINKGIYIKSIEITYEAATTPTTTTTFGGNSGKTFTFTNGTLDGFTTPTATATKSDDNTDLSNLIEYTSSDAES